MTDKLWTSGQTSGLTHIPPQTIRRYVSRFRQHFSETAQRPTKGRRFTHQDINRLLLIRHLYNSSCTPEKIETALSGEWTPPGKPMYDNLDALSLVETTRQQLAAAGDKARLAKRYCHQSEAVIDAASHLMERFRKVVMSRQEMQEQLPRIMADIEQINKRLRNLERKVETRDNKTWSGFFSR